MSVHKEIKRKILAETINKLSADDRFAITFTKKDGTERIYYECQVHHPYSNPDAKRHGITAKENLKRGNLQFYVFDKDEDGKEIGFRIAVIENIQALTIAKQHYLVVD